MPDPETMRLIGEIWSYAELTRAAVATAEAESQGLLALYLAAGDDLVLHRLGVIRRAEAHEQIALPAHDPKLRCDAGGGLVREEVRRPPAHARARSPPTGAARASQSLFIRPGRRRVDGGHAVAQHTR